MSLNSSGCCHHLPRALPGLGVDLLRTPALPVGPDLQGELDGAVQVAALPRRSQLDELGRWLFGERVAEQAAVDQHQGTDHLGVGQS